MKQSTVTTLQQELNSWMLRLANTPIQPVSGEVDTFEDALGQEGWEVVLALPAPKSDTWDPAPLFATRRAVADFVDRATLELDAELPASTLVRVVPSNAQQFDVAVDDAETPGDASDDGGGDVANRGKDS